jgi:hypothetical protein
MAHARQRPKPSVKRERELLEVLSPGEKQALNELLRKLVGGLQSELGPAPRTLRAATEVP